MSPGSLHDHCRPTFMANSLLVTVLVLVGNELRRSTFSGHA